MDEQTYAALLLDLADYMLPDGSEVQAIWTGNDQGPDDPTPPYWVLVHHDNPSDRNAWHLQYEVRRDGSIVGVRYTGEVPPCTDDMEQTGPNTWRIPDNLSTKTAISQEWPTDLSTDDLRLSFNPWEGGKK